jgi:hypothetical protein
MYNTLLYNYVHVFTAIPVRPCGWTQALVSLQEEVHVSAVAETCSSDSQVLHEAKILDLVTHNPLLKTIWLLVVIGLYAADIGWLL